MISLVLLLAAQSEAFLAAESIQAVEVKRLPADASAALWSRIEGATVWAAPQLSVRLNDALVNRSLGSTPRAITVRAAYDDRSLAIALEWEDATESRGEDLDRFGDMAAVEIPAQFGAGVRLPYVGMGDAEQHVVICMQRALASKTEMREAVAAGFGSSTRAGLGAIGSMRYQDRRWRAVFVRPIEQRGLVPFALAIWDGARNERGGNKAISGWKFLRLQRWPIDAKYLAELSFGYGPHDLGDPARGKPLVESYCAACHHVGDARSAPAGMAPDLSLIGAIATPSYLKRAIVDPNSPIVPHLRAMKNALATMPAFDSIPTEEVDDMVAYLWTLGRNR